MRIEGHGSGEGRGTSPGEVHDIALKAAETDATKRALATFGKPFGLELYLPLSVHPRCSRQREDNRLVSVCTLTTRRRFRVRRTITGGDIKGL